MQVKDMSDQQLNQSLAEKLGWTNIHKLGESLNGRDVIAGFSPDGLWIDRIPDYCNNPAASLEVQERASKEKFSVRAPAYVRALADVMGINFSDRTLFDVARFLNATPRQRAEAAHAVLCGGDDV